MQEGDKLDVIILLQPPPPAPVRLIIALTRSKNFPKLLETVTVLGVKEIFVINTERVWKLCWYEPLISFVAQVEPGYWHTHTLERDHIRQRLTEGLEQAVDTVYPRVVLCKKWDRFVVLNH